ncbi:ERV/ALR sulfhydryl oxidase domain-containing protein [Dunaliella salina]|uniref:Sulfhydryl oxidase n=1 Tax=Dunaliella salina TaxID=3046 RepID=A0ABQ7GGE2_DUNSA|nr:ERV/ALR sulfhydryl oxidase domain-containing protein [Dunaliella salina]|eukprot:KAF5833670.1 ERV/ALR sulfhydryl oxidase domain-containing protein [Dunaliella salina]
MQSDRNDDSNHIAGLVRSCQQHLAARLQGLGQLQAGLQRHLSTRHSPSAAPATSKQVPHLQPWQPWSRTARTLTQAAPQASTAKISFTQAGAGGKEGSVCDTLQTSAQPVGPMGLPGPGLSLLASMSMSGPKLPPQHNAGAECRPSPQQSCERPSQGEHGRPRHPWASASMSMGPPPPAYLGSYQDTTNTSREDLGRSTWTLLHMLAAQFPDNPSRQQRRDARQLIDCLTRIYPCSECARHFKEIVRRDPPMVNSGKDLRQWMCRVHNTVNRSLNKPVFNCDLVEARWSPLDCGDENASSCDMGNWGMGKK